MKRKFEIPYSEEALSRTVEISKAAFYEGEAAGSLSWPEFLAQQSRYIKKRWWALQGGLLALLLCLLQSSDSDFLIRRCMGVGAPLFALLLLPELWKNRGSGAMEVECTTYYSLRQIYAARLVLFAGVDFVLLSLFFLGTSWLAQVTVWEMLTQFMLPFNVTCCICFRCLYSVKNGSEVFSLLLCAIFTALWTRFLLLDAVYDAISVPLWSLMLALSFGYLAWCVLHGAKKWEQTWEVKMVWN